MAGTPVYLSRSWPAGVLLIGVLYFMSLLPLGVPAALALSLLGVVVLLGSVFLHEVSHGLAGRALDHPPQAYTLTLWGGYTTFRGSDTSPRVLALTALAGPVTNLLLAALGLGAALLAPPGWSRALSLVVWLNLALGLFNLLPGLPMDGGRALQALAWKVTGDREVAMLVAARAGIVLAIAVLALGLLPAALAGGDLRRAELWLVVIGAVLLQGARQSALVARARMAVAGVDLRRLMSPVAAVASFARVGDVPPAGAVVLDGGRVAAVVHPLPAGIDPALPVTAVAQVVPPEAVLTRAEGADAVADLRQAAERCDVVVLVDGDRYLFGTVAGVARRLGG